jgi:metal-responsive CopG/Arc/MetJ family transcriptional regulator
MNMRMVPVSIDEDLVLAVDRLASQLHLTRETLTANALRTLLGKAKELNLAERDAAIYELFPFTQDETLMNPDNMCFGDPWEEKK